MRGRTLQSTVTTSKFTLPVAIIIMLACWVITLALIPDLTGKAETYPLWNSIRSYFMFPEWVSRLFSLVLFIIIGYFLIGLNNTYAIIRVRASVQTSLYFLFVTSIPVIHLLHPGDIATLFFILSCYFLFKTYQHPRPEGLIFNSFVFAGIGSVVFPQLTFITPVLWLGAMMFNNLSFRGFCAALIGWSVPYWFLFAYAYFFDRMELFYQPFNELVTFQTVDYSNINVSLLVTLGFYFFLFIVSTIHSFIKSYKDKIRTRLLLRFFIMLDVFIFVFIILQPVHTTDLLSLLLVGISILVGHLFVLTNSKASNLFFISTALGLILLFSFNIWMLL